MRIGVPKEIKADEHRVAMTPAGVQALTLAGHTVFIETGAGQGSMITDAAYAAAGATMLPNAADVWTQAEMVVKVKEPLQKEFCYFRKDLVLFTYLHLAAEAPLTDALMDSGVVGIPMKQCSCPMERCRCWLPCLRWQGAWPCNLALYCSASNMGGLAF